MMLFISPDAMSLKYSASSEATTYVHSETRLRHTEKSAAEYAHRVCQIVRHGSIIIMATNFGVTRKVIGSIAMVSSASISS